ncbi:hypothetical protein BDZ89DRAFT_1025168 [Hymenopellis radicata]|nr:hypothetical protein BDZ89DRAFT_1025168 [Hymenopellis radicata]
MDGRFVFILHEEQILVAKVITLYSKGGGKGGKHSWVPQVNNIGAISYMLTQTFEHSIGRTFQRVHQKYACMGMSRFAHLPPGSVLCQINDNVKTTSDGVELTVKAHKVFKELGTEKTALGKAVSSLNTVRRKGKSNISMFDIEDIDDVSS